VSYFEGACADSVCRVTSALSSAGLSLDTMCCSHLDDTDIREEVSHCYFAPSPRTPQLLAASGEPSPMQASVQHWGLKPEQVYSAWPAIYKFRAMICRKNVFSPTDMLKPFPL